MNPQTNVIIRNVQETLNSEKCLTALQTACASNLSPSRLIKTVEALIRKTDSLQECSVQSIYGAVLECATLGLEPILGRAYFVPFRNKGGQSDLQLIIGYQGLIELGRRGGVEAKANAVFEGDELVWESGFEENLVHRPNLDSPRDSAHLTYVYCVWKYNSEKHVEVMNRQEVEQIRNCSRCKNYGPWKDFYIEMAKKTVVRRAAKYWPLTVNADVADALERDDERTFRKNEEAEPIRSGVEALRTRLGIQDDKTVEVDETPSKNALDGLYAALEKTKTPDEIDSLTNQLDISLKEGAITQSDFDNFIEAAGRKNAEITQPTFEY